MAGSWVLEGGRVVRALAVTLLLLFSLALNMARFVGGALFTVASAAFEAVTATRSLVSAHAAEVVDLEGRLDTGSGASAATCANGTVSWNRKQ